MLARSLCLRLTNEVERYGNDMNMSMDVAAVCRVETTKCRASVLVCASLASRYAEAAANLSLDYPELCLIEWPEVRH